mmetsp:Transcript_29531/g.65382  ORF Transcript_29531/g.65382 Transcript_29531/m.65382 type:complete len:496 (-) Transcript_29531:1158-2645(-)
MCKTAFRLVLIRFACVAVPAEGVVYYSVYLYCPAHHTTSGTGTLNILQHTLNNYITTKHEHCSRQRSCYLAADCSLFGQSSSPLGASGLACSAAACCTILLGLGRAHAAVGDALEQALDVGGAAREFMAPEVVPWVLDQLNEGDQQAPWVWPVDDEPLQQHTRDLLLDKLHLDLRKQRKQHAREVVGVAVGVAQLVGNGIEQQVAPLTVQLSSQAQVQVHGCSVQGASHAFGNMADVQHQRVDSRGIVRGACCLGLCSRQVQPLGQLHREVGGLAGAQEVLHGGLERLVQQALRVWDDAGGLRDLGKQVNLKVGGEGVGQPHVAWESRQDEVAHLDAGCGDGIAQRDVVLTQELGEVVQQNQQQPQSALVQLAHAVRQVRQAQVGLQELEQGDQKHLIQGPALGLGRHQQLGHKLAVGHQLQPGKCKARHADGLHAVQSQADGLQVPQACPLLGLLGTQLADEAHYHAHVGARVEGHCALICIALDDSHQHRQCA